MTGCDDEDKDEGTDKRPLFEGACWKGREAYGVGWERSLEGLGRALPDLDTRPRPPKAGVVGGFRVLGLPRGKIGDVIWSM